MATMDTNHIAVAMGQVETTSLPRSSHAFSLTTFFLVTMTGCYFSLHRFRLLYVRFHV